MAFVHKASSGNIQINIGKMNIINVPGVMMVISTFLVYNSNSLAGSLQFTNSYIHWFNCICVFQDFTCLR